ncbi:anti-sigma factor [Pseudomonas abyssi]|jgi:anti-sigma-K factor RskA|uniref:Anti-sigma factor n=1 Tax=Pseudomonas abyssi TaxID=170540 RepID=A0A2A3MED9_9PSED|nr:anti-sigma factor [Pseudomonas abyssi]MAC99808.1 anti-sigma factor [Pseudomonadales bacterium]PBK03097.1 anti-sigma factor [Pseudomonas abyssi]|tara:strand:- start:2211 stop:2927 length:717 start_codon:yes stop_codon:yes gene_type:complete
MIPQAPEQRRALIGEYVLGLLDEPEASEVRELIEHDRAAARMALEWEYHLLDLADALPAQQPSPALWQRLQQSLGWLPASGATEGGLSRWWNSLGLWRLTSAGLALLVLLSWLPGVLRDAPTGASYTAVLQVPGESARPGWVITVDGDGTLTLDSLVADSIPADRSVQFWTLVDPKDGPRSLGLIEPGKAVTLSAEQIGAVQAGQLFELTLEPKGGSPLDRPTGPVLYIGRAVLTASN